jgi:hypothetical protein
MKSQFSSLRLQSHAKTLSEKRASEQHDRCTKESFPKKQVFLMISINIDIVHRIVSHMLEVAGGSGYPKGKHDICA